MHRNVSIVSRRRDWGPHCSIFWEWRQGWWPLGTDIFNLAAASTVFSRSVREWRIWWRWHLWVDSRRQSWWRRRTKLWWPHRSILTIITEILCLGVTFTLFIWWRIPGAFTRVTFIIIRLRLWFSVCFILRRWYNYTREITAIHGTVLTIHDCDWGWRRAELIEWLCKSWYLH